MVASARDTRNRRRSLPVDGELFADALGVLADDGAELLVRDLAVLVEVGLDDGLVDDLLQLHVVEVGADHHLEHLEQLAVADEAVAVDVVHLERDCGGARRQTFVVSREKRCVCEKGKKGREERK